MYEVKWYGAKKLIKEFPQKGWKLRGLNYLVFCFEILYESW